jgi:hypothetical protein
MSVSFQNRINYIRSAPYFKVRSLHYHADLLDRTIQIIVYNEVIVLICALQLLISRIHPRGNGLFILRAPSAQSFLQFRK